MFKPNLSSDIKTITIAVYDSWEKYIKYISDMNNLYSEVSNLDSDNFIDITVGDGMCGENHLYLFSTSPKKDIKSVIREIKKYKKKGFCLLDGFY